MIRTLTGTSDREHDLRRMPCTNTGDLAETLVCLARKLLGTPPVGDTLETVTLGNSNHVNDLILLEDRADSNGLLEETVCELDLVRDGAAVDLDLHEMCFLLLEASLANLGVRKNTDNCAVFADTLEFTSNRFAAVFSVLLGVAGERLLLGAVPVLIESALELVGEVRSPDSGESAETTRSLDVANNANDYKRGGLDDRDRLHDLALVHLCREIGSRICTG